MPLTITDDAPLAPLTTLELGGRARHLATVTDDESARAAFAWGQARGLPVAIVAGGSNLVVADAGWEGLALRIASRGLTFTPRGGLVHVEAQAGEPWDGIVAAAVARGLAGIECLSGIPGSAGATPVQNVGAYGQEVSESIAAVRILDRQTGAIETLPPEACGFGYRDSAFKRAPERHLVLAVTFALRPGGAPTIRYGELREALAASPSPTLADARAAVLALRRKKSMVLDPEDPNRRSVGSFYTNPIVPDDDAARVAAQAAREGLVPEPGAVPRFAAGGGRTKLAAAWLIERAGIARGLRRGAVGVSSRHTLALVHHGGGRTAELVALAREVRDAVRARFGITLAPEPAFLGLRWDDA